MDGGDLGILEIVLNVLSSDLALLIVATVRTDRVPKTSLRIHRIGRCWRDLEDAVFSVDARHGIETLEL